MMLHVTQVGHGGVPLVLFHGWGFDGRIWQPLLPLLSAYHVFMVDLPGFGLSSLMDWEVFKPELMRQLPPQFAVLGWSLGGLFATRLAIEHPEHVTQVMNVASTPCFIKQDQWPGVEAAVFWAFYQRLQRDPGRVLAEFMALQLPNGVDIAPLDRASPSMLAMQQGLQQLLTWDLRDQLPQLIRPVHYVFGRLDAIVSRQTLRVMQQRYPQFNYLMMDKAAHALFLSHPQAFIDIVDRLLL